MVSIMISCHFCDMRYCCWSISYQFGLHRYSLVVVYEGSMSDPKYSTNAISNAELEESSITMRKRRRRRRREVSSSDFTELWTHSLLLYSQTAWSGNPRSDWPDPKSLTWNFIQNYLQVTIPRPYITAVWFTMEQTKQFTLGDNTNVGGYINKPLIPGQPFKLFLRAGIKSDDVSSSACILYTF